MYTYEQKCLMNLGDSYTLLYGFIAGSIIEACGLEGDAAVREATRQFGYDRAEVTRKKHLAAHAKINMLHLFNLYHDLPADPRFRRELQQINPQERVSHTLVCPMADIWKEYGQMAIGRIYCEEFHPACYSHYAFDRTQVNLSKTLTQEGDDYCDFNVVLRPEKLPRDLQPLCFEEYDPRYLRPEFPKVEVDGKKGFALLSIKLYYYLLKCASGQLGEKGEKAVEEGLCRLSDSLTALFIKRTGEDGTNIDADYIRGNLPLDLNTDIDQEIWDCYSGCKAKERMQKYFCERMSERLNL